MCAFSFGKITAIYLFGLCLYSMHKLNTTLNTTAFKYTVVLRQIDRIRGFYCLLFCRVSTL